MVKGIDYLPDFADPDSGKFRKLKDQLLPDVRIFFQNLVLPKTSSRIRPKLQYDSTKFFILVTIRFWGLRFIKHFFQFRRHFERSLPDFIAVDIISIEKERGVVVHGTFLILNLQ